jgi:hypothetical protein
MLANYFLRFDPLLSGSKIIRAMKNKLPYEKKPRPQTVKIPCISCGSFMKDFEALFGEMCQRCMRKELKDKAYNPKK